MAIILSHSHFLHHVAFVSILVFQILDGTIFDFSWNMVVRVNSTGPTNGMRSGKVWEPLRLACEIFFLSKNTL